MGYDKMTTIKLINEILNCKSKKDMIELLKKHRVPIEKSKYC